MFPRVLVANRGEIAVRIMRTLRDLGISPVAVHSESDRHALHVRSADVSVCVGPEPSRESYLRGDAIIEAALDASFTPAAAKAVKMPADGINADLHGSAEYRAALISVLASRAVAAALAR